MKRSFDQVNNEGLGKVIADHYNKIQELGIEQRDESKIIGLRRFNNWIKSMVLNEFIDLTKNNCHANPNNIKVLDIGCGKGNCRSEIQFQNIVLNFVNLIHFFSYKRWRSTKVFRMWYQTFNMYR